MSSFHTITSCGIALNYQSSFCFISLSEQVVEEQEYYGACDCARPKMSLFDNQIFALSYKSMYRVFFFTGPPPKKLKYGKLRLGEVRCI